MVSAQNGYGGPVLLDNGLAGIKWIYSDDFLLNKPAYPVRRRLMNTESGSEPVLNKNDHGWTEVPMRNNQF